MRSLLTRLKRLEQVRSVEQRNGPMIVEFGYVVKHLPLDYSGPRHLVTVGRLPDGKHQWEECLGTPPIGEESNRLLVEFVRAPAADKVDETTFRKWPANLYVAMKRLDFEVVCPNNHNQTVTFSEGI
jgi:hypothetical protein